MRGLTPRERGTALVLSALFLLHLWLTPTPPDPSRRFLRLADGEPVSLAALLEDLADVRIVFMGELHNQPSHHRGELELVRALSAGDRPVAVGLEMFRISSQPALDRWVAGAVSEGAFVDTYYENWGHPWAFYSELFRFARDAGLPLVGLNVGERVVGKVMKRGYGALDEVERQRLPTVRCEVDDEYEGFMREALGYHGADPRFRSFCEAQLVWDTTMALRLLDYVDDHPDTTVVVLAGSTHAWRRGIPRQVALRSNLPQRVVMPEIPGRLARPAVGVDDADYLWLGLPLVGPSTAAVGPSSTAAHRRLGPGSAPPTRLPSPPPWLRPSQRRSPGR